MRSIALLVLLAGCAKVNVQPHNTDGGGGGGDLAGTGGGDAGGGDDLSTPDDLAGADFAGVDFKGASTDLAKQCVLFPQSGCNAGEKCSWDGTENTCITQGSVQNGQICGTGSADDCVQGAECVSAGMSTTTATCRAFCAADGDCTQTAVAAGGTAEPNNKAHCLLGLTGTTTSLCTFACSPIASGTASCPSGLGCQTWASATVTEFTDCGPIGAVGDGGNCPNGNSDCKAGFGCVQTGTAPVVKHCRAVCRQGMAGADCPAGGYVCAVPTGATMFGFCCPGGSC